MSDENRPNPAFLTKTQLRLRKLAPLALLLLAGAGAASWALTAKPPAKPQEEAATSRAVQVHPVKIEALSQPKLLVGTLRARVEGDQAFRVTGKMAARKVQAGDHVRAGTVLATLDETDLRLNREAAEAELAAARSAARQAGLEAERIAELRRKGWSTEQAADRQKAAVDEANGRVMRAERQVELATNSQSYAELKADADGTVIGVFAEAGQVVAAGQAVFRLARDGDREVQVAVPEQDLQLARQAAAAAALWSETGKSYPAELRELSPSADAATRTFLARYTIKGIAADAPLGMTATLTLSTPASAAGARVPLSAILNEGAGTQVYVFDKASGVIMRRAVKVAAYDYRHALVSEGLADGDLVVTLGIHTLRDGQKVRAMAEAKLN